MLDAVPSGSYLGLSPICAATMWLRGTPSPQRCSPWGRGGGCAAPRSCTRFVAGLETVEPGIVDVAQWRPDPNQPPLSPVPEPLRPYVGRSSETKKIWELGGVLREEVRVRRPAARAVDAGHGPRQQAGHLGAAFRAGR